MMYSLETNSQLLPFVSIIMPVHNEEAYIERSLSAVLAQDYPPERMEVILVDGISNDTTREKINQLVGDRKGIIVLDNPKKFVAPGLNQAIEKSKGQIIVRVDGHCEIAPNYVLNCVRHLMDKDIVGVGGPMDTIGETPLAKTIALAMSSRFGVGNSAFRTVKGRSMFVETVPFPAYWRKAIMAAGPYDEELVRNQDDEYNYRLLSGGGKLLLADDVRSRYYSRSNLRSVWRQYYQYGYYKVRVMQKHARQMRLRQFVPALFVAGLLFFSLLALILPIGWIFLSVFGAVYLGSNLVTSAWISSNHGWGNMIALPVVFSILHISYGIGFWHGLVKFFRFWHVNPAINKNT